MFIPVNPLELMLVCDSLWWSHFSSACAYLVVPEPLKRIFFSPLNCLVIIAEKYQFTTNVRDYFGVLRSILFPNISTNSGAHNIHWCNYGAGKGEPSLLLVLDTLDSLNFHLNFRANFLSSIPRFYYRFH